MTTKVPLIIITEFAERMCYYGISRSIITYFLNYFDYENQAASSLVDIWVGTTVLCALIGAYLADSMTGRYKVILGSCVLYTVGLVGLAIQSKFAEDSQAAFWPFLYIIAFATGGIKSCTCTFGADQFDAEDDREAQLLPSYFNGYYFFINIGSLIGSIAIVNIQLFVSWYVGYLIMAVAFGVATTLLFAGNAMKLYFHQDASGSSLGVTIHVMFSAFKKRRMDFENDSHGGDGAKKKRKNEEQRVTNGASGEGAAATDAAANGAPMEGEEGTTTTTSATQDSEHIIQEKDDDDKKEEGGGGLGSPRGSKPTFSRSRSLNFIRTMTRKRTPTYKWLDKATINASKIGQKADKWLARTDDVEDVKLVLNLFPLLGTFMIYFVAYCQMGTTFILQGQGMNTQLGSITIAPATLATVYIVALLLLLPLYEFVVAPAFRKWSRPITDLQRVGAGYLVAAAAMLVAAGVETIRLQQVAEYGLEDINPSSSENTDSGGYEATEVVPMSILWQIPQYLLIALSEVLSFVGVTEMMYSHAPETMKSTCFSLCMMAVALGSYLAALFIFLFGLTGWLSNINSGHLNYYWFILAGMMGFDFILHLLVCLNFKKKEARRRLMMEKIRATKTFYSRSGSNGMGNSGVSRSELVGSGVIKGSMKGF